MTTRLAVAVALLSSCSAFAAEPAAPNVEVAKVEVLLFEADQGTFRPVATGGEANAFGDLAIKVQLKGKGEAHARARKVRVEASVGGRPLFSQERNAAGLSASGTAWQFFFYPTGLICGDLVVTTTVTGQPKPASKTVTLSFACTE